MPNGDGTGPYGDPEWVCRRKPVKKEVEKTGIERILGTGMGPCGNGIPRGLEVYKNKDEPIPYIPRMGMDQGRGARRGRGRGRGRR